MTGYDGVPGGENNEADQTYAEQLAEIIQEARGNARGIPRKERDLLSICIEKGADPSVAASSEEEVEQLCKRGIFFEANENINKMKKVVAQEIFNPFHEIDVETIKDLLHKYKGGLEQYLKMPKEEIEKLVSRIEVLQIRALVLKARTARQNWKEGRKKPFSVSQPAKKALGLCDIYPVLLKKDVRITMAELKALASFEDATV